MKFVCKWTELENIIVSDITQTHEEKCRAWRGDSEIKSTGWSSRSPEFNSQQPLGGSQPSVVRSGALFWRAGMHAGKTLNT